MSGGRSAETEIRGEPEREIARAAYSIARAALDEQHAAVRDLRARTGALLTKKIKSLAAGGDLFGSTRRRDDPASDAYRRLAVTCDRISTTNESHIEVLGRAFTLASVAIVIEVALWGLQLALS